MNKTKNGHSGKRSDKREKKATAIHDGRFRNIILVPSLKEITDPAERRKRAIDAAGRFRSGRKEVSADHDQYLDQAYAAGVSKAGSGRGG